MKTVSSGFKNAIKQFGREISCIIETYSPIDLTTENNLTILTQDKMEIITKDINLDDAPTHILTDEEIIQAKLVTKGEMFSTLMKELDFETNYVLKVGDIVRFKFGVKVNDNYEYIDYGKFIVFKKETNHDTNTFTYICYDYMLKTMIKLNDDFNISYNNYQYATKSYNQSGTEIVMYQMTMDQIIQLICGILDINVELKENDFHTVGQDFNLYLWALLKNIPNSTATINTNLGYIMADREKIMTPDWVDHNANFETFRSKCSTFRDVLDLICKYLGISMYMEDDELKFKTVEGHTGDDIIGTFSYSTFEDTFTYDTKNPIVVDTFDGSVLSNKNIIFGKLYGPINALNLYANEEIQSYVEDSQSISDDGITKVELENCLRDITVTQARNDEIAKNLLALVDGVSYNTFDIQTIGICYLDWLDYFNVVVNGITYKCLMLNSEINIKSGLSENLYTEIIEEDEATYTSSSKSTSKQDVFDDVVIRKRATLAGKNVLNEDYVTYSENERKIGLWYNNKPLYTKTYKVYPTTSGEQVDFELGLSNIDEIMFDLSHTYLYRPSSKQFIQGYGANNNYNYDFNPRLFRWNDTTGYSAEFTIGANLLNNNPYIVFTILYTKTTD